MLQGVSLWGVLLRGGLPWGVLLWGVLPCGVLPWGARSVFYIDALISGFTARGGAPRTAGVREATVQGPGA